MRRGSRDWLGGQERPLWGGDASAEGGEGGASWRSESSDRAFLREEVVSAEPGSRKTCCPGEHKGWKVVAKRKKKKVIIRQ